MHDLWFLIFMLFPGAKGPWTAFDALYMVSYLGKPIKKADLLVLVIRLKVYLD